MVIYNITDFRDATTITKIIVFNNTITNGAFMGAMLISVFFILTMIFKIKNGLEESVTVSSWICFVLSLFLRNAGLINFIFVIAFLTMSAFGTLLLYMDKK